MDPLQALWNLYTGAARDDEALLAAKELVRRAGYTPSSKTWGLDTVASMVLPRGSK